MNPAFEAAFKKVVVIEGGYSNDAADRGGETTYGITEAVARANGYTGDMRFMPLGVGQNIYRAQYWDLLKLDLISIASAAVAGKLFDMAVNCGAGTAGKFLQRALNVFNREGADYPDVKADGVIGPMTVEAFRLYMTKRAADGEAVMLRALNGLQAVHYIDIAEHDFTQEAFVFGWFLKRITT